VDHPNPELRGRCQLHIFIRSEDWQQIGVLLADIAALPWIDSIQVGQNGLDNDSLSGDGLYRTTRGLSSTHTRCPGIPDGFNQRKPNECKGDVRQQEELVPKPRVEQKETPVTGGQAERRRCFNNPIDQ
jgi:hypothetical protein